MKIYTKNRRSNIYFLQSNDFKNINVEAIRDLKNNLQKNHFIMINASLFWMM